MTKWFIWIITASSFATVNSYLSDNCAINWVDNSLDGLDAMMVAWIAEEECTKNNIYSIREFGEINDIIKYNEIDCKAMWDILRYIRSNKN